MTGSVARRSSPPRPSAQERVSERSLETLGLWMAIIAFALVALIALPVFGLAAAPIAGGMAVAFSVLVIALRWWIPGTSSTFRLFGYVFVIVILTLAVMYAVGYYTLTAVELVAGVLVFAWIILFIRNADALRRDAEANA